MHGHFSNKELSFKFCLCCNNLYRAQGREGKKRKKERKAERWWLQPIPKAAGVVGWLLLSSSGGVCVFKKALKNILPLWKIASKGAFQQCWLYGEIRLKENTFFSRPWWISVEVHPKKTEEAICMKMSGCNVPRGFNTNREGDVVKFYPPEYYLLRDASPVIARSESPGIKDASPRRRREGEQQRRHKHTHVDAEADGCRRAHATHMGCNERETCTVLSCCAQLDCKNIGERIGE